MKKTIFSSYFLYVYNPHEIKLLVEEDVRVHCALQVVHVQVPVLAGRPVSCSNLLLMLQVFAFSRFKLKPFSCQQKVKVCHVEQNFFVKSYNELIVY